PIARGIPLTAQKLVLVKHRTFAEHVVDGPPQRAIATRRSEDGRTAFTDGAFFRVPTGEAIRTRYEIAAPLVNASEAFTNGAAISSRFRTPRLLRSARNVCTRYAAGAPRW